MTNFRSEQELVDHLKERRAAAQPALEECGAAYEDLKKAKERYAKALLEAHSLGASNVRIAKVVGVTEVAIRNMIKRIEIKRGIRDDGN